MESRPILFSSQMVRAILAGTKTQTRRIVKANILPEPARINYWGSSGMLGLPQHSFVPESNSGKVGIFEPAFITCPYGLVGHELWVRETIWQWGRWVNNGKTKTGRQKRKFVAVGRHAVYVANHPDYPENAPEGRHIVHSDELWVKRPAIFMPRWACRSRLLLTDIRVERLQDISEEDAIAEGVWRYGDENAYKIYTPTTSFGTSSPRTSFFSLWESINGKESLESNPFVWCLSFKAVPDS